MRALRSVVSGGWATEDAEVVGEALAAARRLAAQVVADPGASAEVRASAQDLIDRLDADTAGGD